MKKEKFGFDMDFNYDQVISIQDYNKMNTLKYQKQIFKQIDKILHYIISSESFMEPDS